ncbi:MAG: fluoride efflux transporter CrcB [Aeromonadaceae bacterium]|nr:fluoride efflux transporter CrcB [Aeromonadaceae bacterium]
MTYLFVAVGGALGACLRFSLTELMASLLGRAFPYGTLSVNLLGSLVMGLMIGAVQQGYIEAQPWRPLIMVGLLGALTTFSSFSLDTLVLLQQGAWLKGALNVLLNVTLCLGLTWLGMQWMIQRG